jgi:hypothetical protein
VDISWTFSITKTNYFTCLDRATITLVYCWSDFCSLGVGGILNGTQDVEIFRQARVADM